MSDLMKMVEIFSNESMTPPMISISELWGEKRIELLHWQHDSNLRNQDIVGDDIAISFLFELDGSFVDIEATNNFNPINVFNNLSKMKEEGKI
jgi:hypothetical protein